MSAPVHGKSLRKVVVLGAGYVGGRVARMAFQRGHRVICLTRNLETAASLRTEGIEVVQADLSSQDWHTRIDGAGAWVLNSVSSAGGGIDGYRKSYEEGMRSVLAWAERTGGVASLVYTSSTSVYPQDGGAQVDESAVAQPADGPGQVLRTAEDLVMSVSPEVVRRWCVFRLAGIYGPGRHHVLDQLRAGAAELGGVGSHHLNLIHRDDIAEAVFLAWEKDVQGVFNLADDGPVPKETFVRWLVEALGVAMPNFSGRPTAGRRAMVPDRIILNGKAKEVLGWVPKYPDFRSAYREILGA